MHSPAQVLVISCSFFTTEYTLIWAEFVLLNTLQHTAHSLFRVTPPPPFGAVNYSRYIPPGEEVHDQVKAQGWVLQAESYLLLKEDSTWYRMQFLLTIVVGTCEPSSGLVQAGVSLRYMRRTDALGHMILRSSN